jgi:hypothetical protein
MEKKGLSYSKMNDLIYISTYDGIIGLKKYFDHNNKTRFDSFKFLKNSNYMDQSLDNTFSIGDMTIFNNFMFVILDVSKKIVIIDLFTSNVLFSFDLPGQNILWQGVYVQSFIDNVFVLYLTNESPSEIWKFHLNTLHGFHSCSWSFNGFDWRDNIF